MQNNDKKVLLRFSNLKQYFPLKGGRFVKANDGISLDIYEGETFGLVGESGCGKSTLGRTILQLYHQTYGRTMYYGRSLDDLAPKYVIDTVKNLKSRRAKLHELEQKRDKLEAEYAKMYDEKGEISFGSQIRNYVLQPYQLVKDLRTGHEVGNPRSVLDGGLDGFIEAYLRMKLAKGEVAAK